MTTGYFLGQVYAVDDRHQEIALVMRQDDTDERVIVQPEVWDESRFMAWLTSQQWVVARGLAAVGLPQIMRAEVVEVMFAASAPGSYTAARGAFDWTDGDEPAEASVRRMRGEE